MGRVTDLLFATRSKPRGDEADAHVSDLYGCDRATWYRRNGHTPEPFTAAKLAQFAVGLGYESAVATTLADAGCDVRRDLSVTLCGLTGHPDIAIAAPIDEFTEVIEVKTTEARAPKGDGVSPHYAIQAAAYALALGAPKATVLVKHAGSHLEVEYDVDPEDWRETIVRRADEIHARTALGAPMPPAEPDPLAKWGCTYCDFWMCERNPHHTAYLEAALAEVAQ